MGLFDWFRRRAPASAPATSSVEQPPKVPFLATIASFVSGDGLGTLRADGVSSLRFGRSACRGFEPAVGVTVEVVEIAAHPLGGFKATALELKMNAAAYDAALVDRDTALGIHREPADPIEAAAATAEMLGWVIVLLREAPPRGPAAFAEWAKKLGLPDAGIRVQTDGVIHLGSGKHDALAYVGDGPFPQARLASFGVPEGFDRGQGFIGLGIGLPSGLSMFKLTNPSFDVWAENGMLRDVSKIARALSVHGPAVLLPQAGVALDAELFRGRLGDLDDLTSRPFGAWVATSMDPAHSRYSSFGMSLMALPDVEVTFVSDAPWELDRAREAVLAACSTMVHANRELEIDERLEVPIGQSIDAHALRRREGDSESYVVERQDGRVLLEKKTDARTGWASGKAALNTYQRLLDHAYEDRFDAQQFTGFTPELEAGTPGFEVEVRESSDGYFMTTSGVGRQPQRFGSLDQRNQHIELVAAMKAHHPLFANLIATVAMHVHLQASPAEVFKSGDTVSVALSEIGAAGFVLAAAGHLNIADGPSVHLLELVPLSKAEYDAARTRGSSQTLVQLGKMTPQARAERWRLKLVN